MNQPNTLRLPNGYPGRAYSHDVPVIGPLIMPTASARLYYAPNGRLVGPDFPQPTVAVLNNTANPAYWIARIEFSADISYSAEPYWLELLVNEVPHSAGRFFVNYQTAPL
jgi:hypothetical protein